MLRAVIFVTALVMIAGVVFKSLVDQEVRRVLSVHVLDKASHLVDMLEADANALAGFEQSATDLGNISEFIAMAASTRVAKVDFHELNGEVFQSFQTSELSTGDGHHNHGHGHHDHGGAGENALIAELSVRPAPQVVNALLSGERPYHLKIHHLDLADGSHGTLAQVLLPIAQQNGQTIGFATFKIDVSHVHTIYSGGVWTFGAVFLFFGCVLFSVPGFAFWLQKRTAERSSRQATYLAQYDPLTGLLNRSAFLAKATSKLADAAVGAVIYIDLDHFKKINDSFGHPVGDALLKHIGGLARQAFGEDAVIARLGGDEFIVLTECESEDRIAQRTNALLHAARDRFAADDVTLAASISVGVALPRPGDTIDNLLTRADIALYYSKARGRDRAAFYTDEMGTEAARRRFLEAHLRDALDTNSFQIAYQPLVDATTLSVVGYEALLRLKDADGTSISPEEFVPVAEEIGLIEEIGSWVLRTATREVASLDETTGVSINLSAEQFSSGQLIDTVKDALKASGLAAHRLELEITESLLLGNDSATKFQIDALKELGISIALDDFGTGYSSLATLWRYGFDRIKIDKSFVHALGEPSDKSAEIIEGIALMADRLGMRITVEGIETEKQQQIITRIGCEILQGYLFGRPEIGLRATETSGSAKRA